MSDEYPEHEKLSKVSDQSQAIGQFLEWCEEQGWHLAEWSDANYEYGAEMYPISLGTKDVLAEYFDIDLGKIEDERDAMLEKLREMNA